ncbi:MAG: radical SAM protein [Candidatus Aminicenantia bacterium]
MKKFYIQWHIIDRCNLRCKHCYQDNFSKEKELDINGLKEVAKNILLTVKKWRAKVDIAITGGEPLLKKEIFELLSYLQDSEFVGDLSIITNGTMLKEYMYEFRKFKKLKEIKISLDGVSEEINDWIRGKGSFSRTLENFKEFKTQKIPSILMFTVMKKNLEDALRLTEFVKREGFDGFIIERFFPLGQSKEMEGEVLSGYEFLFLWRKILDYFGYEAKSEELIKYRAIKVLFNGKIVKIMGSGCIVGRNGIAILPDGTVLPCRRFPLPIGNLRDSLLYEIWEKSDVLNFLRRRENLKGICKKCSIKNCIGCRAMSYCLTGDYLQEDPHCWIYKKDLLI